MPYVTRLAGQIIASFEQEQTPGQEFVALAHADWIAYDLAQTKTRTKIDVDNYSQGKKAGLLSFKSKTFDSLTDEYDRELERWSLDGSHPLNFYLTAIDGTQVTITLSELTTLTEKRWDLHYACRLNEDIHKVAIEALGTKAAVESYDYTGGWPTVPYS